ncbi:thiopeptide-type bacteriocin biosynthesis protein [Sphingobacterium corticibacterium]|uniref:Thiopeptide-type bacteriocin biosynthesis domain-containing protein n=1 Tax=Sphingobacterium corticibacterium TaxID=2484746 RepID=A0A4Q6XRV9_9SPHI|nr:thiopeptide-type bacteriocin biosynthesis protein [Sphingobacterium corticibacterium]RZF60232.1 hypothetical protein EWE74_14085 [Sphingobacterium corticibacterium]
MEIHPKRTFIPGDDWVYFKLYTGYKTADIILKKTLPTLMTQLYNQNILQKWFFLRYADPDFHLRIRLLVRDKKEVSSVIHSFNQSLASYVQNDLIWKVQLDTYQREIERYGIFSIEHAESIFQIDSDAIVHILKILDEQQADGQRWLVALKIVDDMISDFQLDINDKSSFLNALSDDFKKETGFHIKGYKLQLDRKYRTHRRSLEQVMTLADPVVLAAPVLQILERRSAGISPIAAKLLQMEKDRNLDVPIHQLLRSLIHMTVNRMFRSKQRVYEMVIYDMLSRYYCSLAARNKRNIINYV